MIYKNLKLHERIYAQYADKPKTVAWLNTTREIGEELAKVANQVRRCFDIDSATGETLEIIGRIVVIDRIRKEQLMNSGIFSDPDGTEFNEKEKQFAEWSVFKDEKLSDELLRLAIRAKIIKNTANPTADELLDAFRFLFPSGNVFRLINHHDMSFTVEYIGLLSSVEQWVIDLEDFIPTPQGVRLRGFVRSYGIIEFLNDDDDSSFGDEDLEFLQ